MARQAKARAAIPGSAAARLGKDVTADNSRSPLENQPGFVAEGFGVTRGGECGAFALGTAPRVRACLSCREPGVAGLCTACTVERVLDRIAEGIAEQAERFAEDEGPSAERLPVCEHLRPRPSRLRCSRPELEVAGIWTRQPERCVDGWFWEQTSGVPAPYAEAWAVRGNA
jgi:hypothetical protein